MVLHHGSTDLYETSMESRMNRIEGLEGVRPTPTRFERLLRAGSTISFTGYASSIPSGKVSSVSMYWHQLSQVYIEYNGRRISPLVLKKVYEVYPPNIGVLDLADEIGLAYC